MLIFEDIHKIQVPVLEDGQIYIYVLQNAPQGNIKIGRSSNMKQRLRALSGSNSGGNQIVRCAVSDATWLYSLEGTAQTHFHRYRIPGTEWFRGDGVSFEDVVAYIDSLFGHPSYDRCNELRKQFMLKHDVMPVPKKSWLEEEEYVSN